MGVPLDARTEFCLPIEEQMKPLLTSILVLGCILAGCSPKRLEKPAGSDAFRQLTTQFKDRAVSKTSDRLSISVTEQVTGADPAAATIQVRKQTPGGVPANPKKTAEVIDVYFRYEGGRWRCARAESKDFEGEKVVGQNSLGGPDIGLTNLFIWMGL